MSKIGIGVLSYAHGHVTSYSHEIVKFDDAELLAVWDDDIERGKNSAEAFGASFKPHLEDVLDDPAIDLVFIASETNKHADLAVAACAAKKAVILQKPMALSMADCDRIIEAVQRNGVWFSLAFQMRYDPANIRIASCESRPDAEGRSLAELLEERGSEQTPEEAAELIMEIQAEGGAQAIYFCLADEDIERIMRHPRTMIASDSHICSLGEGVPHPRNYGTFPRVFRLYVRELGVLTYAEAVRRMTSLPAEAFRLHGRGTIARGMFADICVFDPETVADAATWENPHRYPVGIKAVVVNGRPAVWEGRQLGGRAGRALRRQRIGREDR